MKPAALILLLSVPLSAPVLADSYAGLVTGMAFIEVDSETFRPWTMGLVAGHRLENGIGAELDLRTGLNKDTKANVEIELEYQASGYITFSELFNKRAYLTLGAGYATTRLDSAVEHINFPGSQNYNGPTFLARLEEQLKSNPDIVLSLSYQHFYLDGGVSIRGGSFGVVYEF